MPDQSSTALDPQTVAYLLGGGGTPTVPKQQLPPGFAPTGEQNPLVEAMISGGPHPDTRFMAQEGYTPQDIAVALQMDKQRQMTDMPRGVKEAAISPIRPILDAGQYLGDAMRTGGATADPVSGLGHLLDVGSMFMGPESLAKDAVFIGAMGAKNLSKLARAAGEKAFDPELNLYRAMDLEKAGANKYDIWHDTHWWRAPDTKWKMEVPDNALTVTPKGPTWGVGPGSSMQHDVLSAAYPQFARELRTEYVPSQEPVRISGAFYRQGQHELAGPGGYILTHTLPEDARSTSGHELQHAVSGQEGFARGGSSDSMLPFVLQALSRKFPQQSEIDPLNPIRGWTEPDIKTPSSLAFDAYKSLADEVMARNVQHRLDFNPHMRYSVSPPWETMDTPANQQIIIPHDLSQLEPLDQQILRTLLGGK